MPRAYLGIGSNQGEAGANLERAISALAELGTVLARSSVYWTAPWGFAGQPDFLNAVVLLETALAPRALLDALEALERRLGRTPAPRWGPRIIDLDILTYDDATVREPGLTIPHELLYERAFVLAPLAEIAPEFAPALARLSESERAGVRRVAGEPS